MKFKVSDRTDLLSTELLANILGIDFGALTPQQEALLPSAAVAAQRWAEGYLGAAVGQQLVTVYFDSWPSDGVFNLPVGGINEMWQVECLGTSNTIVTLDHLLFDFVAVPYHESILYMSDETLQPSDLPPVWPLGRNHVKLVYQAGFETWAEVDPRIWQAITLKACHFYLNKSNTVLTSAQYPDKMTANELLDQILKEIGD